MTDHPFTFRDRLDGRGPDHSQDQWTIPHPPFKKPARTQTGPHRDRYRMPRHDAIYDVVEDDGFEQPLDSFDERVMQQQPVDRQSRAARGEARLSLAPQSSKFFGAGVSSQVPDSHRFQDDEGYQTSNQHGFAQPAPRRNLSQFSYNSTQFLESSPDAQLGASSSPAFMAGQRRAEHTQTSSQPTTQPHQYEYNGSFEVNYPCEEPLRRRQQPTVHPRHHEEMGAFEVGYSREEPERFRKQPAEYLYHHEDQETFKAAYQLEEPARLQPQLAEPASFQPPTARTGAPITQGIQQVLVSDLPDRLHTIFPYPIFNAVQSKCFTCVYKTDNNFVLASPTGSGKTVVLELAICRAISKNSTSQYKIVYQAPTKALCSERQRDWQKKFSPLGLNCVELTGDSDSADLRNVQSANIIITTPEKWDSVTRKWKDHEKLMRLVSLFLIDEVHLLKEDRGAILEVIVSRMKSIGTDVRFVALSATVPNFRDVATWLGKNSAEPYEPAIYENFGEDFRPVKLQKHVCGYQTNNSNDFAFETILDRKLLEVVRNYSEGKPIIVFCITRNSTTKSAKVLANWWSTSPHKDRLWKSPSSPINFRDRELRECAASGVAFHHAGIDTEDRIKIEKAYLEGELSVICCTSTLAVGVNLPCHLVILKNTVSFNQGGLQEYSDLEIMQMLGRAGRPQFDDSAVAVIMTRQNKVRKYELMVSGQEVLESTLHLNLIDHMNAEIGLGTIRDLPSARRWLASTFLYVRIKENPAYYKLEGSRSGQSIDEQLDEICSRDISLLQDHNLVTGEQVFRCTDYGHAMAQYYVHFDSMRIFMGIASKATISEILSAIAQASEFESIRFRGGEKSFYKGINKSPYIRFPIPVNLDLPAHKVSLLIQSVIGAADISWDGEFGKHRTQYTTEATVIFKHINRLIRCVIDVQIFNGDSVSINSALVLERSFAARVWDDSPLQMKQIDTFGVITCRKMAQAGIRSIEELECTEAHRIETILSRNPPYGMSILGKLKAFPKLRVSLAIQPSSIMKTPEGVKVLLKTDIGFINEKIPETFASKAVYVCMLAETSDGRKVHFSRLSAKKLGNGQSLNIPALLTAPGLSINCFIMCDGIAGTMRTASVTPKVAVSMFPPPKPSLTASSPDVERPTSNMSRRRSETVRNAPKSVNTSDEFDDDGIDDDELVKASFSDLNFDHIDNYANPADAITRKNTAKNGATKNKKPVKQAVKLPEKEDQEARQLENGKWACNHACKDKEACKHLCCKQGMDKPPKKAAPKRVPSNEHRTDPEEPASEKAKEKNKKMQTKLQLTASKRKSSAAVEEMDLTQQEKKQKAELVKNGPKQLKGLHQLHRSIQKKDPPSSVSAIMRQKPSYCYSQGGQHELSFMGTVSPEERPDSNTSSDYGDLAFDDLSAHMAKSELSRGLNNAQKLSREEEQDHTRDSPTMKCVAGDNVNPLGVDESMLDDIMLTVADSQDLRAPVNASDNNLGSLGPPENDEYATGHDNDGFDPGDVYTEGQVMQDPTQDQDSTASPVAQVPMMPPEKGKSLFLNDTNIPWSVRNDFKPEKSALESPAREEVKKEEENCYDESAGKNTMNGKDSAVETKDEKDSVKVKDEPMSDAYKDVEPWLYEMFGGIVEVADDV